MITAEEVDRGDTVQFTAKYFAAKNIKLGIDRDLSTMVYCNPVLSTT